jgi:predicted AlkP superfamily phosphohydrolase/phosphomutase
VVVIGFDGFTWKTLEYLKNDLSMPNLDRLRKGSAWGILESTLPSNTVPAWISFATGMNPGKHGVFDFTKAGKSVKDVSLMSSRDIKADTIQQILKRNGLTSVLINLHGSTPALTDDITLGSFTSSTEDLFSPKGLADDPDFSDYPAFAGDIITLKDKRAFIADLNRHLDIRMRIAKNLFQKKPDLFFLLFSESDHVQHAAYDQIKAGIPDAGLKDGIISLYRKLDDALGWFMDNIGEDTYLILMSDHGFESYRYVFSLNNYLESMGLLVYSRGSLQNLGLRKVQEKRFSLNIKPVVVFLGRSMAGRKALDGLRMCFLGLQKTLGISKFMTLSGFTRQVDRGASKAFCTEAGLVFINRKSRFQGGLVSDEEAADIRRTLLEGLKAQKSTLTGKHPFRSVNAADGIYHGPHVGNGPEIIIEPGDHGIGNIGYYGSVFSKSIKNFHDRDGIFAISGPGIRTGESGRMSIMDVAPTVLHLLGQDVPMDMDGKVMARVFSDDSMKEVGYSKGGRMETRAVILKLARSGAFAKRKDDEAGPGA